MRPRRSRRARHPAGAAPPRPCRRQPALRTRIGINTGPVIGVTIGAENRLNYTLLGDAVNVASRVEQLNKQFGTSILATESTVRAAGASRPAGGWARPTCAATPATSWSIASDCRA